MAIISCFPEIDVRVWISGRPATEYPSPDQRDDNGNMRSGAGRGAVRTHECYIESKSGQTYTVDISTTPELRLPPTKSLLMYLSVDGEKVHGVFATPTSLKGIPVPIKHSFIGPQRASSTPGYIIQDKLRFSPVSTVEESSKTKLERDSKIVANLGIIEVEIFSCTLLQAKPYILPSRRSRDEALTIAEKAMKGKELSHGTTYSQGETRLNPGSRSVCNRELLAVYKFHYRSHDALQREMILPPRDPAVSDEVSAMTEDEARSLAQQYLRLKREPQVKSEDKKPLLSKRTIDLTEDDDAQGSGCGRVKRPKAIDDGCDFIDLT
ncbi:hypothetical protein E4U13_004102 [Claviceps humidiphila]|uniref:DUF7918 domain-containing protein n=1 Tax=Claviceps humidiphila TaxID=1294629 RepID=A0A9P7TPC6_9HYPO|nr:hypothetical protein E4U13_004102 [Claviceps humidiphila]